MANQLATPVFSAGAKDNLAAADVYKVDSTTVVNSIQSISQKQGGDFTGLFGGLKNYNLGKLLSVTKTGVKVDQGALADRLLGMSSSINASFKSLSSNAKTNLLANVPEVGKIDVQIGGIKSTLNSFNFKELSSLGKFVNEYTKSSVFSIVDNDATAGLISAVVQQGAALGVNGLLPGLAPNITNNKVMARVINKSMPDLVKRSDLNSLSHLADSAFGTSLDFVYPNFASDLAKAYGFKSINDVIDPLADYHSVLTILSKTNNKWDVYVHEGDVGEYEVLPNNVSLIKILNASKDFQQLISTGIRSENDYHRRHNYGLIQNYKLTTVEADVARYFPQVAMPSKNSNINTSITKKNRTVDARALAKIGEKVLVKLVN